MNKEFWVEKGSARANDEDGDFGNAARIGPKRPHQWFMDAAEADLYPSKKQELQTLDCKPASDMLYPPINPWDNATSLHSVSNQFMDRLFGNETPNPINFAERNSSSVGRTDDIIESRKENNIQFSGGVPVSLNISHVVDDPETCLRYAGFGKLKASQAKEYNSDVSSSIEHVHPYNRESETNFVAVEDGYYNGGDASVAPNYVRADENTISMVDHFAKVDSNIICFDGFPDEQDLIPVGRPLGDYDQLNQPASLTSDTACEKKSDAVNTVTVFNSSHVTKLRVESISKNHPEAKTQRKRAPNSFPSNVRSLISTGMLDGVPVKYVSLGREELRGIIKGSGYLCGCQSCNYTEVLNAYEFERHAGCKTKHPNNHVYFENGKTIYQIVQELRNTPTSLLFDTIQTVFGAPINQKSFRVWKESFQAATRELQRIYGTEELNL